MRSASSSSFHRARSIAACASAVVAGLVSFGLAAGLELDGSTGITLFVGCLVGLITLSQLATPRLAPPRFSAWTGEAVVDLDEMGMGAQATIVDPLRRAVARARKELVRLTLVSALGAAVGSGVALGIDGPVGALAAAGGITFGIVTLVLLIVVDRVRTVKGAVREVQRAWHDPYGADAEASEGSAPRGHS